MANTTTLSAAPVGPAEPAKKIAIRVLVAYAPKEGPIAEIARITADELRAQGCEPTLAPVDQVQDVDPFGAVLLGSEIAHGRWRREAIRFGERRGVELLNKPLWLFDSDASHEVPESEKHEAVSAAEDLADKLSARDRVTFGEGPGTGSAPGPGAAAARPFDPEHVRRWARSVATHLHELEERLSAFPRVSLEPVEGPV